MKSVPLLDHIISIRDQNVVPVLNRAHQDLDLKFIIHLRQRPADQTAVRRDRELDQFHLPLHKSFDLTRIREQQQPADLISNDQLRIHRHTQMKILLQKSELVEIDRIAHTRDRMFCSQPFCDQTAQQITFVRRGTGDHKVRMGNARLLLHRRVHAVSVHTRYVEPVDGISQLFLIPVDHHHIIVFDRKLFCKFWYPTFPSPMITISIIFSLCVMYNF